MDGCVHLLYNSSWIFHLLAAEQLLSGQPVQYGKGRRYGLSITFKITPAGSLSSSLPGGPPCRDSPLRPHWPYPRKQPASGRRPLDCILYIIHILHLFLSPNGTMENNNKFPGLGPVRLPQKSAQIVNFVDKQNPDGSYSYGFEVRL